MLRALALAKVPVPLLVQMPPVAVVTDPRRLTVALLAHTVLSIPALTVGALVMVSTIISETAVQVPFPVVVSVRVIVPLAVSALLGV